MREKLCLVTGAAGFVGGNMVRLLLRKGYRVRATDLQPKSTLFDYNDGENNLEYRCADLLNPDAVDKLLEDVDWVFHIAGLFRFEATMNELIKANVHAVKNVVQASLKHDVEVFVHFSTTGVYGSCDGSKCIDELSEPNPDNKYEISKYLGEKIVENFMLERELPAIILRPTLIYGPGSMYGHSLMIGLLAALKDVLREVPFVKLVSGPIAYNIHVEDVVSSALYLAENEHIGEKFLLCDDTPVTVGSFLDCLAAYADINRVFTFPLAPPLIKLIGKILPYLPNFILNTLNGVFQLLWSRYLKKYNIESPLKINLSKEWLYYMISDHEYSNDKLKSAGYDLRHPNYYLSLRENVNWLKQQKWIN